MLGEKAWMVHNPSGRYRVIVTMDLPGKRWLEVLTRADCRVEVFMATDILSEEEITAAMGDRCDGVIGQLTETWGAGLFLALKHAGGRAYSNYAVGYNNVDVAAATARGIGVGNTPGVLTETTAEMAVGLTFAAARRIVEGDGYMRKGRYKSWLPDLFLGELLWRKVVGVIGAGRIGSAYARMMVEGHKMDLIYYDLHANKSLEDYVTAYSAFLEARGESPLSCIRARTVEQVLREADVVSLHTVLDQTTRHLIDAERLSQMKENAILVNSSRGPLVDETALVAHCRDHPDFRAALDVFEDEPDMKPGLKDLENVVIVPHLGSATSWTREGMGTLAALNVAGMLMGYPVWGEEDISAFLGEHPPKAAPSVINAKEVGLSFYGAA